MFLLAQVSDLLYLFFLMFLSETIFRASREILYGIISTFFILKISLLYFYINNIHFMSIFLFFIIALSIIFDIVLVFSMNVSVLLINYPFIVLMTFTNIDIIKIHILSMFSTFQFTLLYRHYFIF